MALRQQRLKLLVAYSTVAQIGYLFLVFPLALNVDTGRLDGAAALAGGMLQVVSHAAAKAGMFMAAGTIYVAFGHDHIARLGGVGRALPLSVLAFVCGGCTLIGLPPGGPFLAKSLLLTSPIAAEQWWWDWVMFAGGTLTSSYMIVVLMQAFAPAAAPPAMHTRPPRYQELVALVLASTSLLLGLAAFGALAIVQIGRPDAADIPDPMASLTDVFTMSAIAKAFAPAARRGHSRPSPAGTRARRGDRRSPTRGKRPRRNLRAARPGRRYIARIGPWAARRCCF